MHNILITILYSSSSLSNFLALQAITTQHIHIISYHISYHIIHLYIIDHIVHQTTCNMQQQIINNHTLLVVSVQIGTWPWHKGHHSYISYRITPTYTILSCRSYRSPDMQRQINKRYSQLLAPHAFLG